MNTTSKYLKDLQEKEKREEEAMTKEQLERLERIENAVAQLTATVAAHLTVEEKLQPKLEDVLETFVQAQGVLKFVKICAAVSASLAGGYLFIKEIFTHIK